ncbi:MAG: 4-alpha-glucanotransferase, partial [Fibrobacterota bacterium]
YLFYSQWHKLRDYASEKDILIMGDLPIFVSYDSSDVWGNQDLFKMDAEGKPEKVAGVPPDYFSETGQLWGNPVYNWEKMMNNRFKWWKSRFGVLSNIVDLLRIDHFRGFRATWEVPASAETAIEGEWVRTPGDEFFSEITNAYPNIDIIAEDLGTITKDVRQLMKKFGFPGMKVMHFAFSGGEFECPFYQPHTYERNCLAYTGTHDNDTTAGWLMHVKANDPDTYRRVREYLKTNEEIPVGPMVDSLHSSEAGITVAPFQDYLELSSEARMNVPGTTSISNWSWRCKKEDISDSNAALIRERLVSAGRV